MLLVTVGDESAFLDDDDLTDDDEDDDEESGPWRPDDDWINPKASQPSEAVLRVAVQLSSRLPLISVLRFYGICHVDLLLQAVAPVAMPCGSRIIVAFWFLYISQN